ncbi:Gcn1 [Kluyveromyces lactis]|nr:Gcn1 [Kluyveromyces lactis]
MSTWENLEPVLYRDCHASLLTVRLPVLRSTLELLKSNDKSKTDSSALELIFNCAISTYDLYQDKESKVLATSILVQLFEADPIYCKKISDFVVKTASTQNCPSKAVADYLNLLEWVLKFLNLIYEQSDELFNVYWKEIVHAYVVLVAAIETILDTHEPFKKDLNKQNQHRKRLRLCVFQQSVKSFVNCVNLEFTTDSRSNIVDDVIPLLLDNYLKSKLPNTGVVITLGSLVHSVLQCQAKKPIPLHSLEQLTERLVEYLGKEVILAKELPSAFCLELFLKEFLYSFVTEEQVQKHLIPSFEKANLRSPETSFTHSAEFYSAFNSNKVNSLGLFVSSKCITQTFTSFKSSKDIVRESSLKSLISLLRSICSDSYDESSLQKLVDEAFKNMKTNLNTDYKIIISNLLINVPTFSNQVSSKIVNGLRAYISKESNETALNIMLSAFFHHLSSLETADETSIAAIKSGFNENKLPLRKIWYNSFLSNLNTAKLDIIVQLEDETLAYLKEVFSNPLKNGEGSAYGCFVYIQHLIDLSATAILSKIDDILEAHKESYGLSWIYVTLSTQVPFEQRKQALKLLNCAFYRNPQFVGNAIIDAFETLSKQKNDTLSRISFCFAAPLFNTLSQKLSDKSVSVHLLKRLLVLSQLDGIKLKNGWAGLVLNAELDPSEIVREYGGKLFENMMYLLNSTDKTTPELRRAIIKAISHLSFINPEITSPLVASMIQSNLDAAKLSAVTEQEVEIWSGKEGELVVDVLSAKQSAILNNKNSKDYEILKWQESIRKDQAKKGSKKLTKEEQQIVDEQLKKESNVRSSINELVLSVKCVIDIISQLASEANLLDNGIKYWFPTSVNSLLDILQQKNFYLLFGSLGFDVFLQLSFLLDDRLGMFAKTVGYATMIVHRVPHLLSDLNSETKLELISTALFKIKHGCRQIPFQSMALTYILPLLVKVMEIGKKVAIKNANKPTNRSEFVEEDPEEEQLLLALDIISTHGEAFQDTSIPRQSIVSVLLSLLALPSKAKLAKEYFISLCQNISIHPTKEDLSLLLKSLLTSNQFVQATVLEALDDEYDLEPLMEYSPEVYITCFNEDENNRDIANFIWKSNEFKVTDQLVTDLLNFFEQEDSGLRLFTARAYASAVMELQPEKPDSFNRYFHELLNFYALKSEPPKDILDDYGLVKISATEQKDPWEARSTTAIALKELCRAFSSSPGAVVEFVHFLIDSGALGDREEIVRQEMKEAGIEIINYHGNKNLQDLMPIFENFLSSSTDVLMKENVVILYGSLARHLKQDDPRIRTIAERLLSSLQTPSEELQKSISKCLSALVPLFQSSAQEYIDLTLQTLFDSPAPKQIRRGAAWGIAGLVKGYGISALSEFDVIRSLIEGSEDKKDPRRRESVAYGFECLSLVLGKFFEPYVIEILPNILKNLGDPVPEVREATAQATKAIMSSTTSFGVKKLIPVAVSNLDDISWRTKRGSVELLGNMAYLDPTQLSASLSTIVPEIVGVLNDTHKEVRKAADESLNRFGEVIRNPEIQKLVPTLINAIGDPTKYTEDALDALIQTQFVHYIDGPSLALIIHVIHRGMRDRSANTKRKACKIVGNMAILVDTRDLVPYLQQLIDEVEIAMVDPVPNTRATAARALGALVERLGEEQFPDLIPRLMSTLSDNTKSGDRMGSAQALAEVISGLGLSKLEELLPTILSGVTNYRAYVREGFMPLMLFLPVCFGQQFAPYINKIIQPILSGLADPDENIRDTALKAGKLIVKNYATKAIDLLLPELENGMFDENERIRLSSVQLAGDLLFQVTGISSKNEFDEEDAEYNSEVSKQMVEVLGEERRARILSALFVCRSDVSGIVRATTVDIWKALVPNTPRTIKEILPELTSTIVIHLASSSRTLRIIAAQTLGDLVRRVGGNALSQLLPTLKQSLDTSIDSNSKQGVCIALHELIVSSSSDSLEAFQSVIVDIICSTIIDGDETVREAAATCFDAYQEVMGKVAIDEIIPFLLNKLKEEENSQYALSALQEIMSTKSEVIFPILIPTLLTPPIDAFKANALGSLAEVAGPALYKRTSTIINSVVNALIETDNTETKHSLESTLDKIFLSITDYEGLHPLLQQIMSLLKHEDVAKRIVVLERLPTFFDNTTLDYNIYTSDIATNAILSLDESDPRIVEANFNALTSLVKNQDKSMLEKLIKPAKQALLMTGKQGEDLAAFKLPKGPSCVLPIFLHGLMYGSGDEREASALAIADIVSKTPAAGLKSYVTVITGPLIRVVGERFNSDIKAAILYALNILFAKIPQLLRPFIPQLQRTFVKSLSDPTNEVLRLRAAKALGTLIEYQPRVDPLVVELVTGAKQSDDDGVKTAMLKALLEAVSKAGSKLNQASKTNILNLIEEEMLSANDKLAVAYAKLIGSLSSILTTEDAATILKSKVLESSLTDDSGKFGILTLNSFLKDAPSHVFGTGLIDECVNYIIDATNSSNAYFSDNGLLAIGKTLLLEGETRTPYSKLDASEPFHLGTDNINSLVSQLAKCMLKPNSNSLDSRRLALVVVRTLARFKYAETIENNYDLLAPSVFSCLRDTVIPIKLAAEKAYLAMFHLVEEENMETFTSWFSKLEGSTVQNSIGDTLQLRSLGDYTKRVGKRLAAVEREKIAAGGDAEAMFSDRFEDENEIWTVGGVELNTDI